MLEAKDIVVWINDETKEVMVKTHAWGVPTRNGFQRDHWCDPIGAAYLEWQKGTDQQRVRLMLETVIDLGRVLINPVLARLSECPLRSESD
jgi:hypothetical protein